jgi:hypothetical protein
MKKVLLLLLSASIFNSCYVSRFEYNSYTSTIDYSEYTKAGFFITESNSVSFEYQPLGSITVVVKSGDIKQKYQVVLDDGTTLGLRDDDAKWKEASSADALVLLHIKATQMNANGIINLKTSYIPEIEEGGIIKHPSSVVISGMAIRKN